MSSYSAAARSTLARSDSPMPMDTSSIRSATSRSTSNKMDTSDRSHDDISIISELMNGIQHFAEDRLCRPCRSRSRSPPSFNSQAAAQSSALLPAAATAATKNDEEVQTVPPAIQKQVSKALSEGILQLGFQDITPTELYWIFIQLNEMQSNNKKGKKSADGIGSSSCPVFKINLAGNRNLGNELAEYLHLLPDTVCDLDLSYCGLSSTGIRYLCQFMETNTTITRLVLWGNVISEAGALYIRDVIKRNTTLTELCCYNDCSPMPTKGKLLIADGLGHNHTLRRLLIDDCQGLPADPLVYSAFRTSLERCGNKSSLEVLEIGPVNRDPNLNLWSRTMHACENLINLGPNSSMLRHHSRYMYWLNLNVYKARKITHLGKIEEFQRTLANAVKEGNDDVIYYLIRNNVEHIK